MALIRFLATADHLYTLSDAWRRHPRLVTAHSYNWLFRQNTLDGGTWAFTDQERLSAYELDAASLIATQLQASGLRVLNHPARVKFRYELLLKLQESGINAFGAWRASSRPKPDRFPVLLKAENDHAHRYKDLIASQETLDATLDALALRGVRLENILVITFANSPTRQGVYTKHSVFRVGEQYFSFPRVIEDNWAVKYGKLGLASDHELDQAIEEINTNPFAEMLKPAFDAAGIEYGRADFGFENGHLAVYEINTNPSLPGGDTKHRRADFAAAINSISTIILDAIANSGSAGAPVKIDWSGQRFAPSKYVPWRRLRRP
jgi:hypothetical protein